MNVADLFAQRPFQWGLRGDPWLWEEMQTHFHGVPLPATMEELRGLLEEAYEALTGHPLSDERPFCVERFKHGGMSSGFISPRFWVETAIPLLLGRYGETAVFPQ